MMFCKNRKTLGKMMLYNIDICINTRHIIFPKKRLPKMYILIRMLYTALTYVHFSTGRVGLVVVQSQETSKVLHLEYILQSNAQVFSLNKTMILCHKFSKTLSYLTNA